MRTGLQVILESQGKSQSELARLVGQSPSFISRLAAGKETPSKDTIDAILKALRCTYEEAFGVQPKRRRRAA